MVQTIVLQCHHILIFASFRILTNKRPCGFMVKIICSLWMLSACIYMTKVNNVQKN